MVAEEVELFYFKLIVQPLQILTVSTVEQVVKSYFLMYIYKSLKTNTK